jgi:hypothetical protein
MTNLTEKQIITILKNKAIDTCTDDERKQVMKFAFGDDYIKSNDKGKKKLYKENK